MGICKICLKPVPEKQKNDDYHDICIRGLFGSVSTKPQLSFDKNKFVRDLSVKYSKGMSISGVQKKLSMTVIDNEICATDKNGKYILKPTVDEFPQLSENEHLSMKIGALLGITTPPCGLVSFSNGELAYIIKRFDWKGSDKIKKEDLASIFNLQRDEEQQFKYSKSYEEVGKKIFEATGGSLISVYRFFEQLVYNFLINNGDYHLKNISLQSIELSQSIKYEGLTPNYDSVMTRFYLKTETDFALDFLVNGEFTQTYEHLGFYSKADFEELAKRLDLKMDAVNAYFKRIQKRVPSIYGLIENSYLSKEHKTLYRENFDNSLKGLFS